MVTLGEAMLTEIDFGASMRARRVFSQSARDWRPGGSKSLA